MTHLPVVPFLLPAMTACALVLLADRPRAQRALSVASTFALLVACAALTVQAADGGIVVYAMGAWPAHLGIVFVVDRLSAWMLLLTAVVGFASLLHAVQGWDARGTHFHPLFQFQLMGLNGAFLTGDLFNLFVCFELMLIASYCLLQHGGGGARLKAGIHYVVLNLVGSALFLIAASLLYRVAGTLNMADLARLLPQATPAQLPWVQAAAALLLVVFLLKAAIAPLYLWLPGTYRVAAGPVAALFPMLTKVGAYAIVRVTTLVFAASPAAGLLHAVVLPLAVVTVAAAAFGTLASTSLKQLAAWLVLGSTAMLLVAFGQFDQSGIGAGLFYLPASTLGISALFVLTDRIADVRGEHGDHICRAPRMPNAGRFAVLMLLVAMAVLGLPPLAGFVGKLLILRAAEPVPWVWGVVLGASLLQLVAVARAGVRLFWAASDEVAPGSRDAASLRRMAPVIGLLGGTVLLSLFAGPVERYVRLAAGQVLVPKDYIEAVLGRVDAPGSLAVHAGIAESPAERTVTR